jgi:uncharacterized membrane protein
MAAMLAAVLALSVLSVGIVRDPRMAAVMVVLVPVVAFVAAMVYARPRDPARPRIDVVAAASAMRESPPSKTVVPAMEPSRERPRAWAVAFGLALLGVFLGLVIRANDWWPGAGILFAMPGLLVTFILFCAFNWRMVRKRGAMEAQPLADKIREVKAGPVAEVPPVRYMKPEFGTAPPAPATPGRLGTVSLAALLVLVCACGVAASMAIARFGTAALFFAVPTVVVTGILAAILSTRWTRRYEFLEADRIAAKLREMRRAPAEAERPEPVAQAQEELEPPGLW